MTSSEIDLKDAQKELDNSRYIIVHEDRVESHPAEINMEYVKNMIYERENPHPLVPAIIFGCVLLFIYLIYIIFIKNRISGEWVGVIGDYPGIIKFKIKHDTFLDNIVISVKDYGVIAKGKVIGNTIFLDINKKQVIGVLLNKNKIKWVDSGDIWQNVKTLR